MFQSTNQQSEGFSTSKDSKGWSCWSCYVLLYTCREVNIGPFSAKATATLGPQKCHEFDATFRVNILTHRYSMNLTSFPTATQKPFGPSANDFPNSPP